MKELLIGVHLLGLSMSFVNALSMDARIARQLLYGTEIHLDGAKRSLTALRSGFYLLLLSGFGLIFYYWLKSPELLANPKIWAKTLIVTIAAFNGAWIERRVLPSLSAIGPLKIIYPLSISWASWTAAFVLGAWKSINFVASFSLLMASYVVLVLVVAFILSTFRLAREQKSLVPRV